MDTHLHAHHGDSADHVEIAHEGDDLILSVAIENGVGTDSCPYELKFRLGKEPFIPCLSEHSIEHRSVRWVWDTTGVKPGTYTIEVIRTGDSTKKPQPANAKKELAKARRLSL